MILNDIHILSFFLLAYQAPFFLNPVRHKRVFFGGGGWVGKISVDARIYIFFSDSCKNWWSGQV